MRLPYLLGYLRTFLFPSPCPAPAPFHEQNSSPGRETGQGLVEYALLLVLVSIVVLAILTILGPQIGNVFSRVTSDLIHVPGP